MLVQLKNFFGFTGQVSDSRLAEPEVLPSKPLPMVGLFTLLTDEQKRLSLQHTGHENFGPDDLRLKSVK